VNVIVAPHPDDEVIGCWTLLRSGAIDRVIYYTRTRTDEIRRTAKYFGFEAIIPDNDQHFKNIVASIINDVDKIYVPHPMDHHPDHRRVTFLIQSLYSRQQIMYYSVDMNLPWAIKPLGIDAHSKYYDLITCYPSQQKEFDVNHHWWLFEGITPYPSIPKITVEVPFMGYHKYPDAPENRKYLRYAHQHVFTAKIIMDVAHLNRWVEFHDLREQVLKIIHSANIPVTASTEEIAGIIWDYLKKLYSTYIFVCVCEEGNLCGCYGDPLW